MADFEKAFDDFIGRREYDQAANALFSMVRISFKAGWLAAGGKPPMPQKVIELVVPQRIIPLEGHPDAIEALSRLDLYTLVSLRRAREKGCRSRQQRSAQNQSDP